MGLLVLQVSTLHYKAGDADDQFFEILSFTKKQTVNVNRGQRRTTVLESRTYSRLDLDEIAGKIQDTKVRMSAVAARVLGDLEERAKRSDVQASFDMIDPAYWAPIGENPLLAASAIAFLLLHDVHGQPKYCSHSNALLSR